MAGKTLVLALVLAALAAPASGQQQKQVKQILHFSDVHLNLSTSLDPAASAAIPIRYYSDAPVALLEAALAFARDAVAATPDVLLYTGDHAAHGDFSDAFVASAVRTNVGLLEKFFPLKDGPGLEATAVIGNADGNPDYHMEVTDPRTSAAANPSITLISEAWRESLSEPALDLFNRRGYLKYAFDDRLELITLNTVPYSPSHVPDTSSDPDPFGQFAWLDATLAALQAQDKLAYITGHIAPIVDSYGGNPQWHVHYIDRYKTVVGKYPGVVKAQFFGHVHSIEFRVPVPGLEAPGGYNNNAGEEDPEQLIPLFVTGSISPLFGNNPSFIVWDFDAETYDVLDFTVYGSDIADSAPQLAWRQLFKATTAYGVSSLAASELNDFVTRAYKNASLLEEYSWNMKAQSPKQARCTSALCHAKTLCTMKWWSTRQEFLACIDSVSPEMQASVPAVEASPSTSSSQETLASADVMMAIGTTVLATTIAVGCVAAIHSVLRARGVLTPNSERVQQNEDVFPML